MGATQTLSSARPSDTSSDRPSTPDVQRAAAHLVDYRDGLAGHLMWLAKDTAELSADEQTIVVHRLLLVLGKDEAMRRGAQITTLAGAAWGIFAEIGAERLATVDTLRAVCRDTATAVRDELYRDACACREVAR